MALKKRRQPSTVPPQSPDKHTLGLQLLIGSGKEQQTFTASGLDRHRISPVGPALGWLSSDLLDYVEFQSIVPKY